MARGNTYKCVVCGQSFRFCPKCQITEPLYDAERYCCKEHADIFAILSKHGCHLATAEETLAALEAYNLDGLNDDIQEHIASLQPKKVEVKAKMTTKVTDKAENVQTK